MQSVFLDSSVFISAFRKGGDTRLSPTGIASSAALMLSAVVLEELYAGTSERNREVLEQLERDFERISRIVVPTLADWAEAGRLLARLAAKYDYEEIDRGRLTNDALIATSAGRLGILVLTANARDFRRLAEFCSFQWQQV